jgi:hypothetical protein
MTATIARTAFWCLVGLLVALVVHYMLYRMTLPIQPFIYLAF